ncbi:hypothetical protein BC834DRAFT_85778 [Gloeopeniophorella convolvens]|nr:hypothetical protein BC834DRAFT_85778 [Gloeopeniophorella convolvens]
MARRRLASDAVLAACVRRCAVRACGPASSCAPCVVAAPRRTGDVARQHLEGGAVLQYTRPLSCRACSARLPAERRAARRMARRGGGSDAVLCDVHDLPCALQGIAGALCDATLYAVCCSRSTGDVLQVAESAGDGLRRPLQPAAANGLLREVLVLEPGCTFVSVAGAAVRVAAGVGSQTQGQPVRPSASGKMEPCSSESGGEMGMRELARHVAARRSSRQRRIRVAPARNGAV